MRHPRAVVLLSTLLVFLAGCNAPATETATATSAVVLQGPTTAPPEPTEAAGSGACANDYLPVVKGATWTYQGTTARGDYTEVDVILDVAADAFARGVRLTDITYEEAWTCTDEGLVQFLAAGSPFTGFFSGPDATVYVDTVDNQGVTLPSHFEVGDEWDQTMQLQISSPSFNGPATLTHEFSADRAEEVTVAGSVFQAIVLEVTSRMEVSISPRFAYEYETTQWFVPGVGLVKLEGEMGTIETGGQVTEGGPEYDVSYEMVGYSVP